MISDAIIQEITHKIDIIDIITGFINLKRRGANYLGLCPFHDEKTPSFTVSPAKGIYKCFGCGASGNAITFLMQHEKFSFVESIRWLGKKYNIEIEETTWNGEQSKTSSLHIVNEFAAAHFHRLLPKVSPYIAKRGINEASAKKFLLGFDDGSFAEAAKQNQYSDEIVKLAGLVSDKGMDAYRDRIIFPIHNAAGKIAGFGARKQLDSDFGPKYINTQENDAYNKSNSLYGLYQASRAIIKSGECILVEGYTDVISLHQGGIENVVASSGTSLTSGQVRLIKKYTDNVTIIYDGDDAGTKAALRGMDIALEQGLRVKSVILPINEDPDSYMKLVGPKAFQEYVINHRKDFVVIQLALLLSEDTDAVRRAEVINTISKSIAKMNRPEDFSLRQDYVRQCAQLLNTDEIGMLNLVNSLMVGQTAPVLPVKASTSEDNLAEKSIVRVLIEHGDKPWADITVGQYLIQQFDENELIDLMEDQNLIKLVTEYKTSIEDGVLPDTNTFLYSTNPDTSAVAADLLSYPEALSEQWSQHFKGTLDHELLYEKEITSVLTYFKLRKVKKLIRDNQEDLKTEPSDEDLGIILRTHKHLKEIEIELTSQLGATIIKK